MLYESVTVISRRVTEMQLPMVPHEITGGGCRDGRNFDSGWYPTFVDERADQFLVENSRPTSKYSEAMILCIAWNMGQLGLTRRQCGRVMALWGHPVLEPYMYEIAKKHDIYPKEAESL